METAVKSLNQVMFTKMVQHLRQQNSKSIQQTEFGNDCMYRGEGGKMCAVGCLISDGNYSWDLEGTQVTSMYVMDAIENSGFNNDLYDIDLLKSMQNIHDKRPTCEWEDGFDAVALEYNLEVPEKI